MIRHEVGIKAGSAPTVKWHEDPKALSLAREELRPRLSQGALAKLAGMTRAGVANIESGRRPFSPEAQKALWEALSKARAARQVAADALDKEMRTRIHPGLTSVMRSLEEKNEQGRIKITDEIARDLWRQHGRDQEIIRIQSEVIHTQQQIIVQLQSERAETTALKQKNAELMDLLDLKTREVVLRERIEAQAETEKHE